MKTNETLNVNATPVAAHEVKQGRNQFTFQYGNYTIVEDPHTDAQPNTSGYFHVWNSEGQERTSLMAVTLEATIKKIRNLHSDDEAYRNSSHRFIVRIDGHYACSYATKRSAMKYATSFMREGRFATVWDTKSSCHLVVPYKQLDVTPTAVYNSQTEEYEPLPEYTSEVTTSVESIEVDSQPQSDRSEDMPRTAKSTAKPKTEIRRTSKKVTAKTEAAANGKPKAAPKKKAAAKKATPKKEAAKVENKTEVKSDLRKPQRRILTALLNHESLTRKGISQVATVDNAFCTELLGSLKDEVREANDVKHFPSLISLGLIKYESAPDENDKQTTYYSLTAKGTKAADALNG